MSTVQHVSSTASNSGNGEGGRVILGVRILGCEGRVPLYGLTLHPKNRTPQNRSPKSYPLNEEQHFSPFPELSLTEFAAQGDSDDVGITS